MHGHAVPVYICKTYIQFQLQLTYIYCSSLFIVYQTEPSSVRVFYYLAFEYFVCFLEIVEFAVSPRHAFQNIRCLFNIIPLTINPLTYLLIILDFNFSWGERFGPDFEFKWVLNRVTLVLPLVLRSKLQHHVVERGPFVHVQVRLGDLLLIFYFELRLLEHYELVHSDLRQNVLLPVKPVQQLLPVHHSAFGVALLFMVQSMNAKYRFYISILKTNVNVKGKQMLQERKTQLIQQAMIDMQTIKLWGYQHWSKRLKYIGTW
ncbi:Hypothetical_protein [Hexamita inflata]|uniref:Hypothetical_protein n=1 Tax=Hexamita inflata TaxID=28002 RepID=A0AA86RK27_9EUKA|nr:Hypothetical protein HINF_LOCUS63626 [Hexamita inflata]